MHLKTLTMKGFKSFADATTLELEPGVIVVVGPNGSGKSNVVDAIAWVLGAQAPSAVRSQKMDDVIFLGTSKRTALGRAEVELTIDNASGMLPIEFSEVTITRTLFRSGDSEYAINGAPCRLLDIQELLSDSGVGRQQHVIISQGQIDAVLNARPEDRRLIIEEAAGVLKYRKRKEKSERRLASTEANLTRLGDLLREVRRQLRPLERQADAARRHGSVVAELTALRIYVAGREYESLRSRSGVIEASKIDLGKRTGSVKSQLAEMDAKVAVTESRLTAMGGDDLGDSLAQFEALSARARGLDNLLGERRKGIERDREASVDQGVVATLEAEAAQVRAELAEVEAEASELAPLLGELERAQADLVEHRAAFEGEWAQGVPAPSGQAAQVRGELMALESAIERGEAEIARVGTRLQGLEERQVRLGQEAQRLRGEISAAEEAELPLVEALDAAEQRAEQVGDRLVEAETRHREAESELHSWQARSEALALALDEARAQAGLERIETLDGVLGTLLELVDVDPGWEAAFEAAAGEALMAVVVDGPESARQALAALDGDALAGAVLALGAERGDANGAVEPGSDGGLRSHVRGIRDGVDQLLDALLAGVVVVDGGWVEAVDLVIASPASVVVTPRGDRFGASGWRLGRPGSGATGAALEEANERVLRARADLEQAAAAVSASRADLDEAQREMAERARALDDNDGRLSAAADGLQRVETDRRDASTEHDALAGHRAELVERIERERARAGELGSTLPELERDEVHSVEAGRRMAEARALIDQKATEVGALRADLDVRGAATTERRTFLARRLAELEQRLARSEALRAEAAARRIELDLRQVVTDRLAAKVAEHRHVIEQELTTLRERRRRQSEATRQVASELDVLRRERTAAERALMELREQLQRVELEQAEVRMRLEASTEAMRRDLDCEPATAVAAVCPELSEGMSPKTRIRELERELRLMGPINPLALEEFEALTERHEFLQGQLDDVKQSRRELTKVIREIDAEISNVFAAAYGDVSMNFEKLFSTLFPGGEGRLRLTDPESLLSTGIEIEARPSGKNVRKLSLLSGGERSLTALAFLFSVFRSRPSPFYVMDEVEAALDDVNLHRFLSLIDEFRAEAQLLIVSHQKRTMEAADCLYGVTMQPGGSSKVVSEKMSGG